MVSRSTKSQTISNSCKWSKTVASYRKWSQTIVNGRKGSQTVANDRKWTQTVANYRKWSLTIANNRKPSQISQTIANSSRRSQTVANDRKWSQTKYSLGLNAYWPAQAKLAQHLPDIGSVSDYMSACNRRQTSSYSQQTQNICIRFVQRRPNVFDSLYKFYKMFCDCWVERSPANTRR